MVSVDIISVVCVVATIPCLIHQTTNSLLSLAPADYSFTTITTQVIPYKRML